MPIEVGVWRIDQGLKAVHFKELEQEAILQQIIADDISVVDSRLMVIGREVSTAFGGRVDILAIDAAGNLAVIELKRNRTPREIVAQILDYGSWVRNLTADEIAETFIDYQVRFLESASPRSINEAFQEQFGAVPDSLNSSHQLVIVAGSLDPSTERIVNYLMDDYGVEINAVFFRVFEDDERRYLTRAWLREPAGPATESTPRSAVRSGAFREWNGECYVSYGPIPGRSWPDAKKYGFVSAGGGKFYVGTLMSLQPGERVWVNVPGTGYVGVGEVVDPAVPLEQFTVTVEGIETPITEAEIENSWMYDRDQEEYFVKVRWLKAVELHEAVKELGFFGNQHTVARPRAQSWNFTVERLKTVWQVS